MLRIASVDDVRRVFGAETCEAKIERRQTRLGPDHRDHDADADRRCTDNGGRDR